VVRDAADDSVARLRGFLETWTKHQGGPPFPEVELRAGRCISKIRRVRDELSRDLDLFADVDTRSRRDLLGFASIATATIALGVGLHNRHQVVELFERTRQLQSNEKKLLVSLNQTQYRLQTLTEDVYSMYTSHYMKAEIDRYTNSAINELHLLAHSIKQGLSALIQGKLSLALVNATTLKNGLSELEAQAQEFGMSIVRVQNPVALLLNWPCTVAITENEAHIWISVPLVPSESSAMEMFQLEHLPVLKGELQIQFDLYNRIIAATPDWSLHAEMTAAELHACVKVTHDYFCTRSSFLRHRRSCAAALLNGDKDTASQLCPTTLSRRPAFIVTLHNASEEYRLQGELRQLVTIEINQPLNITTVCPNKTEITTLASKGGVFAVPFGCFLRTTDEIIYVSRRPDDVDLREEGRPWRADDLLSEEALAALEDTPLKKRLSEFPTPEPVFSSWAQEGKSSWLHDFLFVLGLIFALAVAIDMSARYYALFRHVYQEHAAAKEPECPAPQSSPDEAPSGVYAAAAPVDELPSVLALTRRCFKRPQSASL
jgi:hypothetical protein